MLDAGINICLGVELRWLTEGTFSCRFCLLSRKASLLTIIKSKVVEGSLATVMEALPKKYPVALSLSGKGTLHKIISSNSASQEQAFSHAFPGVNAADFYAQMHAGDQNVGFVSIVRKSLADPLLETLMRSGLLVYVLSIGPAVSAHIWSELNLYGELISFDGHRFSLNESRTLENYTYMPELVREFELKIGSEVVAEEMIVAYAAAFQLLLHEKLNLIKADVKSIDSSYKHFIERGKLKQHGTILLFGLFFLLLVSFLTFSHYNSENAKLAGEVGSRAAYADNTSMLKDNIVQQESLVKQLGWNGGYNYGYLINEIGSSKPRRLILKTVSMSEFKVAEDKQTAAASIKIAGVTDDLGAVNNWIYVLQERPWVKTVKLLQYQPDSQSDYYEFNLLLTY